MRTAGLCCLLVAGAAGPAFSQDDKALESLIRVRAAADAAAAASRQGKMMEAVSLGAAPYEGSVVIWTAAPAVIRTAAGVAAGLKPRVPAVQAAPPAAAGRPASGVFSGGSLGLYLESDLELTTGRACGSCRAPKEGTWYFMDEVIAVPKAGPPALVWIGSTRMFEGATLSPDGQSVRLEDGTVMALTFVPQSQYNTSFYDASSTAFLQNRKLRIRGEVVEERGVRRLVARTIWPEDWKVDFRDLPLQPAASDDDIRALVRQEEGGAQAPFMTRLLWSKGGASKDWAGRPVIGVMLNGAQGDDDETHVGHFSLMTGRFGPNGEMADWIFSNFYPIDKVSEKAILPAFVPMDKYMTDLNSGQSWYRPTHILVAVLKDERTARVLQERYRELYAKFYAHEVRFDVTTKPCSALIMDELRAEGWNVPKRGSSNVLSAGMMAALMAVGTLDPGKGKEMWRYMRQETTRLFPLKAFEAVGEDLLDLGGAGGKAPSRELTPFEKMLQEDLEAVLFVRIPQIPSSRPLGRDPAGGVSEYRKRVPRDRSKWKTHPTPDRPFPPPH